MHDAVAVALRTRELQGIAVRPEKCPMEIGVVLQALTQGIESVPEFLQVRLGSHEGKFGSWFFTRKAVDLLGPVWKRMHLHTCLFLLPVLSKTTSYLFITSTWFGPAQQPSLSPGTACFDHAQHRH
jgi:hypothetical protein